MTKDEALKLAIEAMKYRVEQTRPIENTTLAIEACKQALDQEEHEPVGWFFHDGKYWVHYSGNDPEHYTEVKLQKLFTHPSPNVDELAKLEREALIRQCAEIALNADTWNDANDLILELLQAQP